MAKRKSLDQASIDKAFDRAKAGKGRQLAELVKDISTDDLARAFDRLVAYSPSQFEMMLYGLSSVFAICGGYRAGRADFQQWKKEAIAKARAEKKAEVAA